MKTNISHLLLLPALIAVLNLVPAGRVTAQTLTTVHSFTPIDQPYFANSDGAFPWAGLIINSSGNTLYGTAREGGGFGYGTVFAAKTDGTGFTNLHSFTAAGYDPVTNFNSTNSDGATPVAGLILSGNTLYGTASAGGSSGNGTVFAVNTDGTWFTNLHSFGVGDGSNPQAGLILSGNTLYGTTYSGGFGYGTVFAVNTDGAGFTNLHSFAYYFGANPQAGLILSGNTLYGTTGQGGSGDGTVFALNTDGTGFTTLYYFTGGYDGRGPLGGLILAGNTLYGTTYQGGNGNGTVFAVNTDGTDFTTLYSFTAFDQTYTFNSDGAHPWAGLVLSGNTLYGTALLGGSTGAGTVFAVNTDGTGFTTLHSFRFSAGLRAGLVVSGNTLYGTAADSGWGTVFSISLPSPPVARCKHVTVSADVNCTAVASIDDGSFSPNAGDTITLVQSPPGPYPPGDTSVTLTVTDSHGASNSCVATVTVLDSTPCLIALVQSLGVQSGTANSLIVKLQGGASALDRGNIQPACGNLGAFLNEVNAQEGRKLTAAQADLLIAEATRIRAMLGCR